MQLILFFLGCGWFHIGAADTCFPDAKPFSSRKNLGFQGEDFPLSIFRFSWISSRIECEMAKIIIEEQLGYHVEFNPVIGSSSWYTIRALVGCTPLSDKWAPCIPAGSELTPRPAGHLIFEGWPIYIPDDFERTIGVPTVLSPVLLPLAYGGEEAMCLQSQFADSVFSQTGLDLTFYRNYDVRWHNASKFFNSTQDVVNVAGEPPMSCSADSPLVTLFQKQSVEFYINYTGDVTGVTSRSDGTLVAACDNGWWYSPACRSHPHQCIPFITINSYLVNVAMQWAAFFNMPLAIGTYPKSMLPTYKAVLNVTKVLFFETLHSPKYSGLESIPQRMMFPEANGEDIAKKLFRTGVEKQVVLKGASRHLQKMNPKIFEFFQNFVLYQSDVAQATIMARSRTAYETACDWLRSHTSRWQSWLPRFVPEPTDCNAGTGLANLSGHFVSDRTDAKLCRACPPGRYSTSLRDTKGSTFECRACSEGRFSDAFRAESCSPCRAGAAQDLIGQSACSKCDEGKYATIVQDIPRCLPCQSGRFSSSPGSLNCDNCTSGTYAEQSSMSACEVCPIGKFAELAAQSSCSLCESHIQGSTSARAAQSRTDCFCPKDTFVSGSTCETCGALQVTETAGAISSSECYFDLEFYIVLFVPIVSLIFLLFIFLAIYCFRKAMRRIEEHQRIDKITDCIQTSRDLAFPLVVMSAKDFRKLGRLMCFEEALDKQIIKVFASVRQVEIFSQRNGIIFFSHQWLGWNEPDPNQVHYKAIIVAIDAVLRQMGWQEQNCYLWVDYHSVPQQSKQLQHMAIKTLPLFASLASLFVIVTPETEHADTKEPCNFATHQRRMWCRGEVFSFYCKRGISGMYRLQVTGSQVKLVDVDEKEIGDAVFVFEGACTCCDREHIGMTVCDKELLRDSFVGLYAGVLWARRESQRQNDSLKPEMERAGSIAAFIEKRKERFFPRWLETSFTKEKKGKSRLMAKANSNRDSNSNSLTMEATGTSNSVLSGRSGTNSKRVKKPLFGELIGTLETLIKHHANSIQSLFAISDERNDWVPTTEGTDIFSQMPSMASFEVSTSFRREDSIFKTRSGSEVSLTALMTSDAGHIFNIGAKRVMLL